MFLVDHILTRVFFVILGNIMPMLVSEDANKMCFVQISADNSTFMLGNDRELSFDSIPDALKVHGAVYELVETPASFLPQSQNGSQAVNVWQLSISYLPQYFEHTSSSSSSEEGGDGQFASTLQALEAFDLSLLDGFWWTANSSAATATTTAAAPAARSFLRSSVAAAAVEAAAPTDASAVLAQKDLERSGMWGDKAAALRAMAQRATHRRHGVIRLGAATSPNARTVSDAAPSATGTAASVCNMNGVRAGIRFEAVSVRLCEAHTTV